MNRLLATLAGSGHDLAATVAIVFLIILMVIS
jgi:hypothetical protein